MLRWTINETPSTFRVVVPFAQAFWEEKGITLKNIEYCTKYDLEIHIKGKKKGTGTKQEDIAIMPGNLTKQEPSQFVTPRVTIYEEYTSLTCSAR